MINRRQYTENIIESMHAVSRKFFMRGFAEAIKKDKRPITPSQLAVLIVVMKKSQRQRHGSRQNSWCFHQRRDTAG